MAATHSTGINSFTQSFGFLPLFFIFCFVLFVISFLQSLHSYMSLLFPIVIFLPRRNDLVAVYIYISYNAICFHLYKKNVIIIFSSPTQLILFFCWFFSYSRHLQVVGLRTECFVPWFYSILFTSASLCPTHPTLTYERCRRYYYLA